MHFYSFLLHYTCILIIVYRHYIIFLATSPWRIPLFFGWKCFQSYSYLSNNKLRIKKNSPPLQAPLSTSVNHFKLHIWATNSAFSNNDPPDQRSRWNVEKALFLLLRRNFHSVLKQFSFSLSHLWFPKTTFPTLKATRTVTPRGILVWHTLALCSRAANGWHN